MITKDTSLTEIIKAFFKYIKQKNVNDKILNEL